MILKSELQMWHNEKKHVTLLRQWRHKTHFPKRGRVGNINLRSNTTPLASKSHVRVPVVSLGRLCSTECLWKQVTVDINSLCTAAPLPPQKKIGDGASGHLRHDYLIKYAYFDKILLRMICFYQWSWKLNYKCSLMALAIWDILEPQMFVTWLIIENYDQNIYSKMGKG